MARRVRSRRELRHALLTGIIHEGPPRQGSKPSRAAPRDKAQEVTTAHN